MPDNSILPATGEIIRDIEKGGAKTQVMVLDIGGAGAEKLASASNPIPTTSATDATAVAIQELNDTMVELLGAVLKKLPRLDRFERATVQVSDAGGNELTSQYFGVSTNLVGEGGLNGRTASRMFEPWNFSDAGSARIYQQIIVS